MKKDPVDRWLLVLLLMFIVTCVILAVSAKRVLPQEIPQKTDAETVAAAKSGDILVRKGNVETRKGEGNKLVANIYATPQWDQAGVPLVKFEDGKVKAKSRYVEFLPDAKTAKLEVKREVSNTTVKETWVVPDASVTKLVWAVDTDADVKWNEKKGILTFTGFGGVYMFETQPPVAWDAVKKPVGMKVAYAGGIITYTIVGEGYEYPVTVDPTTSVTLYAAVSGYVRSFGIDTYLNKRNVSSGDGNSQETSTFIGQNFTGGDTYWILRSFLSFPIGSTGTCDACTLYVDGTTDYSTTDFNVNIFGARSYKSVLANADFSNFNGWAASGAYTGTVLNDTWSTSSYSVDWNKLVFNAAGLDSMTQANNDTLWVAMLSSRDVAATAPTGDERVEFTRTGVSAPYLSITYTLISTILPRSITQFGRPTPFRNEAGITVLKQP